MEQFVGIGMVAGQQGSGCKDRKSHCEQEEMESAGEEAVESIEVGESVAEGRMDSEERLEWVVESVGRIG